MENVLKQKQTSAKRTRARVREASRGRHGFSMVELCTVIVIIAIMAAILLPIALHYVDDAKKNAEIAETRTITLALQATLDLSYVDRDTYEYINRTDIYDVRLSKAGTEAVEEMIGTSIGTVTHLAFDTSNELLSYIYISLTGATIQYERGEYTVLSLD
jgi:prepilin-type N-terminal cleavage/methylation domain-containing protein